MLARSHSSKNGIWRTTYAAQALEVPLHLLHSGSLYTVLQMMECLSLEISSSSIALLYWECVCKRQLERLVFPGIFDLPPACLSTQAGPCLAPICNERPQAFACTALWEEGFLSMMGRRLLFIARHCT